MHHKNLWVGIYSLIITSCLLLISVQAAETKDNAYNTLIVAKVGDREIKSDYLNTMIRLMPPDLQSEFNIVDAVKRILELRINTILFSKEAKRLKLEEQPKVKGRIEIFKRGARDEKLIEEQTDMVLYNALIEEKIDPNIFVTDEEIGEYYKESRDECKMPGKIRVRHILIKVDHKAPDHVKKEKKAKAEEVLAKAKAGNNFHKLAKRYSEDMETKEYGGFVDFFTRGSKDPKFEEAAFNLKKDEISDLVLTQKGYHIIKLLDKKEEQIKTLQEATNCIRDKLKQKKRTEGVEELLKKLKTKTPVIIYEKVLTKIIEGSKRK